MNGCLRFVCFFCLLGLVTGFAKEPWAQQLHRVRPQLLPDRFTEDFEGGSAEGWASYPDFEDTAYDFTLLSGHARPRYTRQGVVASGEFFYPDDLLPSTSTAPNSHFLLRAYRPNSSSPQRIGLMRPLSRTLTGEFRLEFEYWLKPQPIPGRLRIEFAGANGIRHTHLVEGPQTGAWSRLSLQGNDFSPEIPEALPIQAVAIIAEYPRGDASSYVYLGIDNFALIASRQGGFNLSNPAVKTYKNWDPAFATTIYMPGDELNLNFQAERPIDEVEVRLLDPSGKICSSLVLKPEGDHFIGNRLYRFSEASPAGAYSLVLQGRSADLQIAKSTVRVWHFKPHNSDHKHPHVYFDTDGLEKLRARAQAQGRSGEIWKNIQSRARSARNKPTPAEGQIELLMKDYLLQDIGPYFAQLRDNAQGAEWNALVYAIDRDQAAGQHARDTLIKMCQWSQWVHPWFQTQGRRTYYPVGLAAMQLGLTYDLVYDLLSVEERRIVREGLMRNAIEPAFQEYFVENRMPTNTSNWISHATAGPLIALLAIHDDLAPGEQTDQWVTCYSGLAEKWLTMLQHSFLPDGGYCEGYGYQNFTLETAVPAMAALEQMFGVGNLAHRYHLDNSYLFPLYHSIEHSSLMLDMGDGHDERKEASNWAWLAAKSSDTLLRSFYASEPGQTWMDLLWGSDSPTTASPATLPPSRIFADKGNAILRTGWDDDAVLVNLRAGPHFNHTHFDQGHFRLRAFGEELISEAGPTDYYEDPYYWSYFIQAAGHNTVLLDNNPESQEAGDIPLGIKAYDRQARLSDWLLTPGFNLTTAEIAPVYRGELKTYERQLCMAQPGYLIVHDRLVSSTTPHVFQWQYHPPDKNGLKLEPRGASYTGKQAKLAMQVLQPVDPIIRSLDAPIPIADYKQFPAKPLVPRAVVQVANREPATETTFLVAFLPSRREPETDPSYALTCEALDITKGEGCQVRGNGFMHHFAWRTAEDTLALNGIETDADFLFTDRPAEADVPRQLAAHNAASLKMNGKTLMQADERFNVSVQFDDLGETWTLQLKEPAAVNFPSSPGNFRVISGDAVQLNSPVDPPEVHFESLSAVIRLERP